MKILVCGGRKFGVVDGLPPTEIRRARQKEKEFVCDELHKLRMEFGQFTLIEGCARGVDSIAGLWGSVIGFTVEEYPADWGKHGKSAGSIRNQQMLFEGQPDLVIAFPGGNGTADMVRKAKRAGVPVREIVYGPKVRCSYCDPGTCECGATEASNGAKS